jgi:2-polyprenyl-3-methyl-5-hydroxy-6-metoxy-1,4-benzoquinol methylase
MVSKLATEGDRSNGWEAVASRLIAERSRIGSSTVRTWCRALPAGASVLDLGCGAGVPVSETLMDQGYGVWGIDASPSLVEAFRRRFPDAQVVCEPVEESDFFGRTYDGIVAIGLMFLLQPDVQRAVIRQVASALNPRGRFLFTAPTQAVTWTDLMTGRQSVSLGDYEYRQVLSDARLIVVGDYVDEGKNHYYDVARP